jgi:hypothetical protein
MYISLRSRCVLRFVSYCRAIFIDPDKNMMRARHTSPQGLVVENMTSHRELTDDSSTRINRTHR